jgi:hypothetical protein
MAAQDCRRNDPAQQHGGHVHPDGKKVGKVMWGALHRAVQGPSVGSQTPDGSRGHYGSGSTPWPSGCLNLRKLKGLDDIFEAWMIASHFENVGTEGGWSTETCIDALSRVAALIDDHLDELTARKGATTTLMTNDTLGIVRDRVEEQYPPPAYSEK